MNAFFVFAIVLSASAVLSTPVPKYPTTDSDNPLDTYFNEWRKHLVKIPRPKPFSFGMDDQHDFDSLFPRELHLPTRFHREDFFKHIQEKFLPKNATNNTVENTREVDGHIIHEKERTYSNGDDNHHFYLKQKTIIIRPKDGVDKVDKNIETEGASVTRYPKPVERVPSFTTTPVLSDTSNKNNPDEDVELIHPQRIEPRNEAIREGNSIDKDDVVDLSKDTRINDLYKGPINPRAVLFDAKQKKTIRENPNAAIIELKSNDLEEKNQSSNDQSAVYVNLEHDTDVNEKTANLKTEEDAETIDTNAIRIKRKNKYEHYT